MRKLTVILLLVAFTTGQYAKQLTYWQCRLSNIIRTDTARCDCEKLIVRTHASDQPVLPVNHNHTHIQSDDLYDHANEAAEYQSSDYSKLYKACHQPSLLTGISRSIDRPG